MTGIVDPAGNPIGTDPELPEALVPFTKIALAMPVHRNRQFGTSESLENLYRVTGNLIPRVTAVGASIDFARNNMVEHFLKSTKRPYLFFIDEDMEFTVANIVALIQAMEDRPGVGAMGGFYVQYLPPYQPTMTWEIVKGVWASPEERMIRAHKAIKANQEYMPVDGLAAGFMIVRRQALEEVGRPWFYTDADEGATEDTWFCGKLAEKNWQSAIHVPTQVGHIGPHAWYAGHFLGTWADLAKKREEELEDAEDVSG